MQPVDPAERFFVEMLLYMETYPCKNLANGGIHCKPLLIELIVGLATSVS